MGRKISDEEMDNWRRLVELYDTSDQTRESFSATQGIAVHKLDYWRRRLSPPSVSDASARSNWIPVKIVKEESTIDMTVGKVRITVKPGFDRELLGEVLRVVAV